MRTTTRLTVLAALAAATVSLTACGVGGPTAAADPAGAAAAASPATDGDGLAAVGLTADGVLVEFDTADPGAAREIGGITGLEDDDRLVGIDYRVQDGKLYGVGDQGGIYTVDDRGAATKVRQLSVDLDGDHFGVDFNPAANALRIVSDTGQNLRQPFAAEDAPTAKDTALTNPATPPATGTTPATGVTAVGYTNNDADMATATTLFDLDTKLDRIAVQSPANAGTLAPTGTLPADVGPEAGLDVYSTLDDGRTVANAAFAAVEVDGHRQLWAVDLLSGSATDEGRFEVEVVDLAVKLEQ